MQLYIKEELTSLLTRHDMIFEKPAKQWEQGVFMGNGLLGTVVWGGMDRPVKISLDRADIWDVRNATPDFEHGYNWKTFSECMEKKERSIIPDLFIFFRSGAGSCGFGQALRKALYTSLSMEKRSVFRFRMAWWY